MNQQIDLSQYREDARGALVPVSAIRPIDLMRDDLVNELFAAIEPKAQAYAESKQKGIETVRTFVDVSAAEFDVKPSKKGNVTLTSLDGKRRVLVAMQDVLTFDERLHAAKALIDQCLEEYSIGANANLKVIVQQAFDVNKEGNISTSKVLALRSYNIQDEKWQRAMRALTDSLTVHVSREYIRLYRRDEASGEYVRVDADTGRV